MNEAAIERFCEMFSNLTGERVRELGPQIYAADARFNDTIVTRQGRDDIVDYLAETAEKSIECKAIVNDQAAGGDGVYLRWEMRFAAKGLNGGKPVDSIGVTHLQFNDDGLVENHQDYWDSRAGLLEHIPAIGWIIRKVTARVG